MSAHVQDHAQNIHPANCGVDFSAGAGGSAALLGTIMYFSFKMGGFVGAGLAYAAVLAVVGIALAVVCYRTRKEAC